VRVQYNGVRGGIELNWEKIKIGFWGAIGGAVILAIVGFNWGGWVTGGTAQERAEKTAAKAVSDRLTPICVTQFNQDLDKVQKLEELKGTDSWKRDGYIEEHGWATMPGEQKPDREVAETCAKKIMQISQHG
jgi:hypothetical protein